MRWMWIAVALSASMLPACENNRRQVELDERAAALDSREQELLLREKTLVMREQELIAKQSALDSLRADTLRVDSTGTDSLPAAKLNPSLTGTWQVKMTCTETSCPGSAVGDTRTEQWQLSYTGNHLVAKAMDHGRLVRTYSGLYRPGDIELIEHRDTAMVYDSRMVVSLRQIDASTMEGKREIVMENDCKIVYALTLSKER
jgi:hypothetical protein